MPRLGRSPLSRRPVTVFVHSLLVSILQHSYRVCEVYFLCRAGKTRPAKLQPHTKKCVPFFERALAVGLSRWCEEGDALMLPVVTAQLVVVCLAHRAT